MDLGTLIERHGFSHYGFAPLETPLSMAIYREWLDSGHHAGMEYLREHERLKENPQQFAPQAKSAIVITRSYADHPYPAPEFPKSLRTALYSRGEDYHLHFRQELNALADELRGHNPGEQFLCFTDSAPILERDLAYRAGLGWFGKNTCLIEPKQGSLFFIGQILTSLNLKPVAAVVPDHCGTCDRCIRACPTGALDVRRLDARKCLSYWNIEAKGVAPEEIRTKNGDWFFGCDICQTVCPWNEKVFGREQMRREAEPPETEAETLVDDLRWLLTASHKEIERKTARSPLSRARPIGLKRNALVVIANRRLQELRPEVQRSLNEPRLKSLAEWTLAQLT